MAAMDDDRELIYTGRKFRLERVRLSGDSDGPHVRELIVHPGAAVILPVMPDGSIVMIRNLRFAAGRELWEIPAGTLEPPEPPRACALRELVEEAGYEAGKLTELGRFYSSPGICTEIMHAYLAEDLRYVGQNTEPGERITVEILSESRVREMMLSGEIADAKTIAALGLYFLTRTNR